MILQKEAQWFVRKVKSLTIEEAKPACVTFERQAIAEDTYLFLNIRFQARSFLYRQVSARDRVHYLGHDYE